VRICSLLPGATEILVALGLRDQLIAISHECDFPPEVTGLPRMTTSVVDPSRLSSAEIDAFVTRALQAGQPLYEIDAALLARLQPDLVVTQDLCVVCAVDGGQVRRAVETHNPTAHVLSLRIESLADLWDGITTLAEATGTIEAGKALVADLRARLADVQRTIDGTQRPRVLCLEWLEPPWIAGHWMPEAVALAGGQAILAQPNTPSPRASWDEIVAVSPEVVIVMPCGFDVARTLQEIHVLADQPAFAKLPAVSADRVYVVDGSALFNRAGPRLVDGIELLARLFRGGPESRAVGSMAMRLDFPHHFADASLT
jgi:iron complex transport system substrate-binding protein